MWFAIGFLLILIPAVVVLTHNYYVDTINDLRVDNDALKALVDVLKKSEFEYVTANKALQETIAANGLLIEERDDEIEQLKNRNQLLMQDLDANRVRVHELSEGVVALRNGVEQRFLDMKI